MMRTHTMISQLLPGGLMLLLAFRCVGQTAAWTCIQPGGAERE